MSLSFNEMGLSKAHMLHLETLGFQTPTPIQQQAIPSLLRGENVIGQAQTGSGKTLAFALPILERINLGEDVVQALILAPTRELVLQISRVFWEVRLPDSEARVVPVYGGALKDDQRLSMKHGAHVIAATPGRLLDFIWAGEINLDKVRIVILDEADRMLEMGFIEDITFILGCLPKNVQMGLFSATIPGQIRKIIHDYVPNPTTIRLEKLAEDKPKIKQICCGVEPHEKVKALARILRGFRGSTLVFCRTRGGVDKLGTRLMQMGLDVGVLHGGKSQGERDAVMRRFRAERLLILVATDIAARGLDIDAVEQVVNFDIVADADDYLHRIGRTGRAGKEGTAITLFTPSEKRRLKEMERVLGESFVYSPSSDKVRQLAGQ